MIPTVSVKQPSAAEHAASSAVLKQTGAQRARFLASAALDAPCGHSGLLGHISSKSNEMKVAEMLLEYLWGDVLDLDTLIRRDGDDRIAIGIVSRVGK